MIGKTVSNYRIIEKLGEGGMGVVYKAEQISLDRFVALKILAPSLSSDASFIKRFKREARAVARLHHQNIIQIHDISEEKDLHFFSMEYVAGQTLDKLLEEKIILPIDEALEIISQAALALEHAHRNKITHRDIKPSNIILDNDGTVKVMDFGLAIIAGERSKLTEPGTLVGTIAYMSPEQCEGEKLDHQTDIYSLGAVLYEMLTGIVPFLAESVPALVYKVVYEEPPEVKALNPDVPQELSIVIARAMAKKKVDRYASIAEFLRDLHGFRKSDAEERAPSRKPGTTMPMTVMGTEEKVMSFIAERTPFVGRSNERNELHQFLNQVARGHGSLIMIGGEPGIGKTRLVEELSTEARQHGMLALAGHCYEMKGTPPYIPFVEIFEATARLVKADALLETLGDSAPEVARLMPELRRMFPDLPPPAELPPEQERRYLFNSLLEFIERAGKIRPMLLILEDLHWADDSTLLLLEHIAQHLHQMAVLIVGTYRDTELKTAVSLARAIEELLRQRLMRDMLLRRLSKPDVSLMLGARSGKDVPSPLLQLIFRETEGNPFFVEEVFKHLAEEGKLFDAEGRWRTDVEIGQTEVPRNVLLVIERRLERVSEECRRVMTAAAVIGRGFGFDLLKESVDADEEALLDAVDEAEQAHIITSTTKAGEAELIFAHELTRQTLVSGLSGPRRQRLHLRVAQAMEKLYAEALDEHASDLAYHLHQAGPMADPEKTTRYLSIAGDKALDAAAFEEALRLYEQVLSLQPAHDQVIRAALLDKRGQTLRSLGRRDDCLEDWREALTMYERLGKTEEVGQICAKISEHLFTDGVLFEAYEIAKRGLEAVGESTSHVRSILLSLGALQISFLPEADFKAVDEMFNQSVKIAEELGDELLLGHVLENKACYCRGTWQGEDSARIGLRAAELLKANGNLFEVPTALVYHHYGFMMRGRLAEAIRVGPEIESHSVRTGHDIARFLYNSQDIGRHVMVSGNLEDCEKKLVENLEFGNAAGVGWAVSDYPRLGYVQLWRGCWEDARASFELGAGLEFPGVMAGYCIGPLFLFLAYTANRDNAVAFFQENESKLPNPGQLNGFGAWAMLFAAIEGLAVLGDRVETAKLYSLAREATDTGNIVRPLFTGLVQTTAGIAAASGSKWEAAEEHYQTALRQAHEIPHKIEQPEVRRWYARMLIDRNAPGDKDKARTLLNEAIQMYREIGMPKHLEMTEELMKEI